MDVDLRVRQIAAGLHPGWPSFTATIQRYHEEISELGRDGLSIGLLGPSISGTAVAEARYAGLAASGGNGGEALNASWDVVASDDQAAGAVKDLTHGHGADVLLDSVGAEATIELARTALDDAAQAYRDLQDGKVHGRAVVVP